MKREGLFAWFCKIVFLTVKVFARGDTAAADASYCNLGKVKLQATEVSGLLFKRTWSVVWPQGPLLFLWLALRLMRAFWADLCESVVEANLSGFWLPSLPSLFFCGGGGVCAGQVSIFHWIPSVWQCQLAGAYRGGSHSYGCHGYLLAMPEALRLPSNLKGTCSQAYLLAMSFNYGCCALEQDSNITCT